MKIVVCGFSRSGTTLMYNMLKTTVENFKFFDSEIGFLWPTNNFNSETNYCTKRPLDVFNAVQIKKHYIDAKIILMIRDIRSIITSKHLMVPNDYFIGWKNQHIVCSDGSPPKKGNAGIIEIYDSIKENEELFEIIKYEDLINDTEAIQTKLGNKFNLTYSASFRDFYKHNFSFDLSQQLNGIRPIEKERIIAWKDHNNRIIEQFTECPKLFDILIDFGYEKDAEWFNEMEYLDEL